MTATESRVCRAAPARLLPTLLLVIAVGVATTPAAAQGVTPEQLLTPGTGEWPTYHGDYSGRRYSPLDLIDTGNVRSLSLAWIYALPAGGPVKATPLQIDGVLYFSTPDHAFAVSARTGREIWHYVWPSQGGNHLGNRGMAALGETLYFETPDCWLVALDMKTGARKWAREICDMDRFYYASVAPTIVKNQVIVGVSGDDMDNPGYLDARDPVTGDLKWRFYTVPQKAGDPGADTWPNEEVMKHGGGMTWLPITYDPALDLIYLTTGNPQPVMAHRNRPGNNLFTGSIVALDAGTGALRWYFQPSPHETHDWDATQTAVLFDGTIDGQPRQLLAQASRNGHFFVLDRVTGRALIASEFVKTNWSTGYDEHKQPIPDPAKMPQVDGALVSPNQAGAANWHPPSFSPKTGLFYVNATRAFSVYYLYDPSETPAGWGGFDRGGYSESMLEAIDYRSGEIRWTHPWATGGPAGVLSTGGNLVFTGGSGGLEALDATTGQPLWHSRIGTITNPPITYQLDGQQHVVVASGSILFDFVMNR
jgi:alcohol dehydrogenase (cytochrome c)